MSHVVRFWLILVALHTFTNQQNLCKTNAKQTLSGIGGVFTPNPAQRYNIIVDNQQHS